MRVQLEEFVDRLEGARMNGTGYVALCPAHEDRSPSLSVSDGEDRLLIYCQAGCATESVLEALGLSWKDAFYDGRPPLPAQPEEVYVYTDEQKNPLYRVLRYEGKRFVQERHENGMWVRGLENTRRVLFQLPELISARLFGATLYIVEGEKDAWALIASGKPATCNLGGAGKGKWLASYVKYFRDANVVIVADRDEEGQGMRHAEEIAESLQGIASECWIVQARTGKDAADHLAAGFRPEDFVVVRRG